MSAAWRKKLPITHKAECLNVYKGLLKCCDQFVEPEYQSVLSEIIRTRTRHYQHVTNAYKTEYLLNNAKKYRERLELANRGQLPAEDIRQEIIKKYKSYSLPKKQETPMKRDQPLALKLPKPKKSMSIHDYVRDGKILYHFVMTTGGDAFLRPKYWPQSERISMILKNHVETKERRHRLIQAMNRMVYHTSLEDEFLKPYTNEDLGFTQSLLENVHEIGKKLERSYQQGSKSWHITSQLYKMIVKESERQRLEKQYLKTWKSLGRIKPYK
ncbi:mitochondrial LYR family protein, implicated in protein assembly or maturation [Schizosaccharomyces osmophilus]|uniref:Mitochondrial LYR family protein, implicated in protein assembly or maturation n=1 Tax=Schizosaccharomyces osmophilus TaxID=2545709 RepID=A0AAE9WEU4_9SCHI|nr:mitochondrial LYR family protein, implicated in protein assembly or maturation [Schizosaccharomyces osmophilus]WBW74984.1 mitochondrial LYR family protein, implicated in protein assembly or maturation [Schizosaccharomyces osmophilus]